MKQILLLICVISLLASCSREPYDVTSYQEPVINPSVNGVLGGLVGIITTDGNMPVEDAEVSIKGYKTTTDERGLFSFENVNLYSDGTYIEVTKPGFLFGSRKVYAIESEVNVTQIELIPEPSKQTAILGSFIESDLLKINLPLGDYLLGANEIYNGEINLQLATIEGNTKNNYNKVPGDLTGVNVSSEQSYEIKALSNFGIFNVSISSQSNEQIQLPKNSKAMFELKLADADLNILPSVISVYHFDQKNGTWIEKSEATLVGDAYVGEIDDSGYWMLGNSFPYADISGSLETPDGTYNDTRVEFFNQKQAYIYGLNSTRSGNYLGRVPQDLDLNLGIFHECVAGNQTEEIGVITQEIESLSPILVETDMENIMIEGKVTDCNGDPTDKTFVKISFKDKQYLYRANAQGNFDFSFANCSDTQVSVTAINEDDKKVSEVIELDIRNDISTGDIQTCNEVVAGYDIEYENMNWANALDNDVDHSWSINRISGSNPRVIFSSNMHDNDSGEKYLQAAFIINEDEILVDYQISFKSQGFLLVGQCEVDVQEHNGITSYKFYGVGDDIAIVDMNLYPAENIEQVNFSLVYYE